MARRVGRPNKPFEHITYTKDELEVILVALKKPTDDFSVALKAKVRHDLKERKRLHRLYENAKQRMFGK
jgi:hypothetical protein